MLARVGGSDLSLNLLHDYYTQVRPNPRVLALCGATERDASYTLECDDDLTVIINAYDRPECVPLVWEAMQYQTRRPKETWIVQSRPPGGHGVPRELFARLRELGGTRIFESGVNHGCWFRFVLAALYCRSRYVAIYDDDTLSGRQALETALEALEREDGVYGARGLVLLREAEGPRYWRHEIHGWPVCTAETTEVDFVGQMWVMSTRWLRELVRHLPDRLFDAEAPGRECGEEMYVSFVAQKLGLRTFVYGHGGDYNARWSSLQAYEMGTHPSAMHMSGGLDRVDDYLRLFISRGWRLLRYG